MPRQHESRFCSPSFFLNSFLFFSLPWTKLNRGTEHRPYEFCRKQNRDELIFQEARVCARWIICDVHVFMCSKFWKHRHYFLYHKGKVFIFVISFHISTLFTYITCYFGPRMLISFMKNVSILKMSVQFTCIWNTRVHMYATKCKHDVMPKQ